jgi:hypothetical protein
MANKRRIEAFPIHSYTTDTLKGNQQAAMQIILDSHPEYRDAMILEGHKIYNAAVRAVYSALCLIYEEGQETIEPEQIRAFKRGLENFMLKGRTRQ